jgi:hypothetical protein
VPQLVQSKNLKRFFLARVFVSGFISDFTCSGGASLGNKVNGVTLRIATGIA